MPKSNRRALVVGIDEYSQAPLSGCVNDATNVASLLRKHADGAPNFAVQLITAPQERVTKSTLRAALTRLFSDGADCDVALFYFAGHGTENDLGGYLVTQDAERYNEGLSLSDVLTLANASAARERIVILDSCHAGHLGVVPASGSSAVQLQEGVSILTAARSSQTATEVNGGGVFTELICGALDGGASDVLGQTTVAAIYTYVEQVLGPWEQRPMFRANVAKLISVRDNQATIQPAVLRMFPALFPNISSIYPLGPSYEPTELPHDPEHEALFEKLQKCRAAKLIEPVDEDHMYYAALRSTGCRLTPLGVHYWRLAQAGQL
jgi:uncharacterized caspase-like protein